MGVNAFDRLREAVKAHGTVPVDLELKYSVIFNTLQNNLPVNSAVVGNILDIPVDLELRSAMIPNTIGHFPVNTWLFGTIGDYPFAARMNYRMIFNTITGHIPVNTGMEWSSGGKQYSLSLPYYFLSATARGSGMRGGGGGKTKKFLKPIYLRGKMILPDQIKTEGARIPTETGRPICSGLAGIVEDIQVQIRFRHAYYTDVSSGRNPINIRALGTLKYVGDKTK